MSEAKARRTGWTDERVETIIGNLLRVGVIVSAVLVLAGGIIYLLRHGGEPPDVRVFRSEPASLRSVGGIVGAASGAAGRGIIQLGLLCLIATPVLRVAFSVFAFAMERDRMYIVVTLVVLTLLLYSLIVGHL